MSVTVAPAVVVRRSIPMAGAVELVLYHPPSAVAVNPGQFFQLAVSAQHTILRRPYSAAWSDPAAGHIGFIFNVVGAGSAWLSARDEGHELDLLGPLGRGFDLESQRPAVCVAGGLGVAVFPGVVQALLARGRKVTMLQGARTAAHLLPANRFPGAEVQMGTDDGSEGHHGSVVELLADFASPEIFACGPTPMLQAVVDIAQHQTIPLASIEVALETPMGCGVGTCLGCAAPRREGGYLLTCQDGPCVRADRIDWDRMTDQFHD
ncbi:MAG: dihydroorotate dehydrogenase electron transfer subunit [Candidatus Dormibacteraeota bacterium]|nr:dihydroorotate dehydrogenase electron transfer subunit [Candidatus Dormibacteraeota bacterium]